jgi:hypothetical protein
MTASDVGDRVVPDLEMRVEEAVKAFRESHRHPANLALHAVGYWMAAKGTIRFLQRRLGSSIVHLGAAAGLVVAGHAIEGNEPFTAIRALRGNADA